MTRTDVILLEDVLESIAQIQAYTEGIDLQAFSEDRRTQDAVLRRLEIIGEAVKGLSAELRERHPDVPWKEIAGARDVLVHEYFRVDLRLAWDMVQFDVPALARQVEKVLDYLRR